MRTERDETFERLCRAEYPGVVRTSYLITGDREEAIDVAQEALTRAYERWDVVSELDRPGAWLQRVAANLSLSWRRRKRYEARARVEVEEQVDSLAESTDLDLMNGLRFLTPSQRAVVVLRYYADQSVEPVARALNKRPGTVRALTSQGLARLREFLGEDVDDDARR